MKRLILSFFTIILFSATVLGGDYLAIQKQKAIDRSNYWRQKGYDFNPEIMTAYLMDLKLKDIDRVACWQKKGYDFNPEI